MTFLNKLTGNGLKYNQACRRVALTQLVAKLKIVMKLPHFQ